MHNSCRQLRMPVLPNAHQGDGDPRDWVRVYWLTVDYLKVASAAVSLPVHLRYYQIFNDVASLLGACVC